MTVYLRKLSSNENETVIEAVFQAPSSLREILNPSFSFKILNSASDELLSISLEKENRSIQTFVDDANEPTFHGRYDFRFTVSHALLGRVLERNETYLPRIEKKTENSTVLYPLYNYCPDEQRMAQLPDQQVRIGENAQCTWKDNSSGQVVLVRTSFLHGSAPSCYAVSVSRQDGGFNVIGRVLPGASSQGGENPAIPRVRECFVASEDKIFMRPVPVVLLDDAMFSCSVVFTHDGPNALSHQKLYELLVVLDDGTSGFLKSSLTRLNVPSEVDGYVLTMQTVDEHLVMRASHSLLTATNQYPLRVNVKRMRWDGRILRIAGNAYVVGLNVDEGNRPKVTIVLKGRENVNEGIIYSTVVETRRNTRITDEHGAGKNDYTWSAYEAEIDTDRVADGGILSPDGYWDLFITVRNGTEYNVARLGRPTGRLARRTARRPFRPGYKHGTEKTIFPYFTPNGGLSLLIRKRDEYETFALRLKELAADLAFRVVGPYLRRQRIWLTWETNSATAQDNSYWLFKHVAEHRRKELNLKYVLRKDSPDRRHIQAYRRDVVDFLSFKHLLYIRAAQGLVSAQTRQHGYIFRSPATRSLGALYSKPFIFLQHGVTAFGKVIRRGQGAIAKASAQKIDRFVVTSDFEKNIVMKELGYSRDETPVLGFTRFDNLDEAKQRPPLREILLIPTWREWLEFEQNIEGTEYFRRYNELIQSPRLKQILETHGVDLTFIIHIKLKEWIRAFESTSGRIHTVEFGSERVADLISRASLMITDYSSVSWDFFYLERPVLFYTFDEERFGPVTKDYIDLGRDLFGERFTEPDGLLDELERCVRGGFQLADKHRRLHEIYFPPQAGSHCDNTAQYIIDFGQRLSIG